MMRDFIILICGIQKQQPPQRTNKHIDTGNQRQGGRQNRLRGPKVQTSGYKIRHGM